MRPFGFQKWSLTRVLRNQKCRADETLSVRFAKLGLALAAGAEPALSRPVCRARKAAGPLELGGGLLPAEPQSTELVPGLRRRARVCKQGESAGESQRQLPGAQAACSGAGVSSALSGSAALGGLQAAVHPHPLAPGRPRATRLQTGAGRREPGMTEPAQAPAHGTQLEPGKASASQNHVTSTNKRGLLVGAFRPGLATRPRSWSSRQAV